ncbi:hypothetical protein AFCDBAGC_4527 [Methylobacterium cerastii]|uniref:DUF1800 domain-containing protein n=2 Tax=Methylobacterium TaxID=407 RepID=A0ABQ4QNM0_9HYPH|nr:MULTISPECIES: DUF1800 domain-containing protein [Methylobacterium]TXN82413.1 DUF1800 domain-containing protein [Methylobacterium sp. WL8]GJD46644.1 hypothetical protein AFCDBAGC_4527 [Methylobacterium cerastii]
MTTDAVLALNRFGVGARPGEVARIAADPRGWLRAQLSQPAAALIDDPALPSSDAAARQLAQARRAKRDPAAEPAAQPVDPGQPVDKAKAADPGQVRRTIGRSEVAARLAHGVATEAGFVERLALFFANHFAVSADKGPVRVLAGAFEREAIRPHVLGRFADMLGAVQRHPAMLVYLDNQRSVGPGSVAGARRGLGLNENLARETLELHTLGVDGGYGQADVTALAAVLTGRGWVPPLADRPDAGRFLFSPNRHEPGPATILGRTYEPGGLEQGDAVLDALARHPATAHHLARKLATHFIADDPPDGAVAHLATAYREGDGDLAVVAAALVATPEAWDPAPRKFKTPYEFVLSAARLVPGIGAGDGRTLRALAAFGQRTFAPPSPRGWPDAAAEWLAPHAFKARIDWAAEACERAPPADNPVALAEDAFGPLLSAATRREIARAETGAQGLALLLMSPEFQRR